MHDLERVEARIAQVREELDRLETARSVLIELQQAAPAAKSAGAAQRGVNGHAITIRRVAEPAPARAEPTPDRKPLIGKEREAAKKRKTALAARIRTALKERAMTSGELIDKFRLTGKDAKQMVYAILWEGRANRGDLTRDAEQRYSLAAPPH